MNLSEIITRCADDGNVNSTITTVSDRLVREINRVSQEIWEGYRWSFRWRNYRIVTDVDVTSGTVTATNGSYSVSASGTPFLSSYVGWHIYFPADSIQNWYRVRYFTSSSQIELDVPYQGTTEIGKSYILRHFDYVLPTENWDIGSVIVTSENRPITILEPSGIDIFCPTPLSRGCPTAVSIYGSDSSATIYSTGTIAGTIDTTTLTGSATSWLANVYPGDLVTIGSYKYRVRCVDTDTQIKLYNNQKNTSVAGTSYSVTRQFGRIMRVMYPSTDHYTIDIRALRKYASLVNNNDTNELLERYPNAVILKTSALELKQQNDLRSRQLESDAEVALLKARAEDDSLTHKESAASIYTYRGYNRERAIR